MDGLRLGIGFSYMPNAMRFCGPQGASEDFHRYLKNEDNPSDVENDMKRFEGLYAYLAAIASKARKKFSDYEVVEAYWIGNELLDNFSRKDVSEILEALAKRGLPSAVAEDRAEHLPHGAFPHHNFNVCYVGVGQITGAVPTTIQNMNDCMTIPGKVVEVKESKLIVKKKFLEMTKSGLRLGAEREFEAEYLSQVTPDAKVGDVMALHWGFASVILTERQKQNMEKYTQKLLDSINQPLSTASL